MIQKVLLKYLIVNEQFELRYSISASDVKFDLGGQRSIFVLMVENHEESVSCIFCNDCISLAWEIYTLEINFAWIKDRNSCRGAPLL